MNGFSEKGVAVSKPSPRRQDVADAEVVTVGKFRNKMLLREEMADCISIHTASFEIPTEVDDRLLASVQKLAGGNGAGGRRTK